MVSQINWSTTHPHIMWSVSDLSITMWDIEELKPKFVHGGHTEPLTFMDLHPFEPQTVASVDENNFIQVFQPTPNAYL